jgi:hypothetical protein
MVNHFHHGLAPKNQNVSERRESLNHGDQ